MTPPHQTEKKTMTTENQKHSKNDANSKCRTQGHPNAMTIQKCYLQMQPRKDWVADCHWRSFEFASLILQTPGIRPAWTQNPS